MWEGENAIWSLSGEFSWAPQGGKSHFVKKESFFWHVTNNYSPPPSISFVIVTSLLNFSWRDLSIYKKGKAPSFFLLSNHSFFFPPTRIPKKIMAIKTVAFLALLLACSVSAANYRLLGTFKMTNPAFLYLYDPSTLQDPNDNTTNTER